MCEHYDVLRLDQIPNVGIANMEEKCTEKIVQQL